MKMTKANDRGGETRPPFTFNGTPRNLALATELAERTADAYCADRYASWQDCAHAILDLGFTERETEAILRSKWMRWAADMDPSGARFGQIPTLAIYEALTRPQIIIGHEGARDFKARVAELVAATFGEEA